MKDRLTKVFYILLSLAWVSIGLFILEIPIYIITGKILIFKLFDKIAE